MTAKLTNSVTICGKVLPYVSVAVDKTPDSGACGRVFALLAVDESI